VRLQAIGLPIPVDNRVLGRAGAIAQHIFKLLADPVSLHLATPQKGGGL
jgi:hypothetical protein